MTTERLNSNNIIRYKIMKFKKVLAVALALCSLGSLAACGSIDDGDVGGGGIENVYNVESSDKTKLHLWAFNGGIGNIWLDKAAERFAKEYKDKEYVKGKKGVYVTYEPSMTLDTTGLGNSTCNVFITERTTPAFNLADSGALLCIDDIVKDSTRVGGALEENLFEQAKGGLKGSDGKYYALPHYEWYGGLSYNVETFNESKAYFAASDETNVVEYESPYGSARLVANLEAKRSKGPDGKADTEDDGMPCSLEELIILMHYFKNRTSYGPIILSGKYTDMVNYLIEGLWGSLAGAEQMRNYYNCQGDIEIVYDYYDEPLFEGIPYIKKPKVKTVTLTGSNGYYGNDMAAKYYAIALAEIIQREGFYCTDTTIGTRTQFDAQMNLYMGGIGQYKKAAMLIEGSYWHNESKKGEAFDEYERTHPGKTADDLDFCFMALPTAVKTSESEGKDLCFLDLSHTFVAINSNIADNPELREAAKDFVRFIYSENELKEFTVETGMPRAINYELTAEQKQSMPGFYERLWELRDNKKGDNLVLCAGTMPAFKQVRQALAIHVDGAPMYNSLIRNTYGVFLKSGMNNDSTYQYGTRYVFDAFRISESQWKGMYSE